MARQTRESLELQEVAERIAFERGRQAGLSGEWDHGGMGEETAAGVLWDIEDVAPIHMLVDALERGRLAGLVDREERQGGRRR